MIKGLIGRINWHWIQLLGMYFCAVWGWLVTLDFLHKTILELLSRITITIH